MATSPRRWVGVAIGAVAVVVTAWAGGVTPRMASSRGASQGTAGSLDDLIMDLQLVPIDALPAKPFALASLDGRRVSLGDLAGRPALLYFWATW